jgi:hypothetical protein
MTTCPLRAVAAASLLTLVAGCATRTETIPSSTAPALAPGTPVVSTAPIVTTMPPGTVIATPPAAAVPVAPITPVVPGVGTSAAPLAAPGRITSTEITTLVGGNTITGVAANGEPYYAWFAPGGQLRFRQGTFIDGGTWRIGPDGRFCTAMTKVNGGLEECYFLYRTPSVTAVRFDRLDGTPGGTFSVLPGNPQAL